MIYAIIIGFFATLCAYMCRFKHFKYGLECAFGLLTIFMAFRFNWGNDYMAYYDDFYYYNSGVINQLSIRELYSFSDKGEVGWLLINLLCRPFGFIGMVVLLTVFEQFIIYSFIKENVSREYYWFAVFIYAFNPTFMVLSSSMIRQFLAMCIFIFSVKYIVRHKMILYFLLIIIASFIHKSAIVLLPIYFIRYINFNTTYKSLIVIIPLFILFAISAKLIIDNNIDTLMSLRLFNNYEGYTNIDQQSAGIGIGIIFNSFLFFLIVSQGIYISKFNKVYILLFLLSILFIFFAQSISIITRIGYFFSIISIVALPIFFKESHIPLLYAKGLIILIVVYILYIYFKFFVSDVWHDSFINYHTIFSTFN